MANTLVTLDMIADRALAVAHEKLTFIGTVNRSYDEEFGKRGAKAGDTIRIRNPNQYSRRQGSRVMDVQDQAETTQNLAVSTQDGVDMEFNAAELALSIDELTDRYIDPAMSVLVSGIEGDFITAMTKATYNTVGTAGTVPGASSDVTVLGNARAKLNQYLAPKDARAAQIDSLTMASIVNAYKGVFEDRAQIRESMREGFIARNAMADWYENERTWTLANPADVAGEIDESANTNFTEGTTTVHMDGLTAGADIVAGMVFTWEGLYGVHPETKAVYAHLQDFVVVSTSGASSGDVDVVFSPAIYTTGAKQNVKTQTGGTVTWTAVGQDNKDITFRGSASTSYRYALMYDKNAFAFATADLPIMDDSIKCVRKVHDGLALRLWQASDIVNDRMLLRLDILYGWLAQRPAHAVRIICN